VSLQVTDEVVFTISKRARTRLLIPKWNRVMKKAETWLLSSIYIKDTHIGLELGRENLGDLWATSDCW
jgi:hypothetical protein